MEPEISNTYAQHRQCTYKKYNTEMGSHNHRCHCKAISIIYSSAASPYLIKDTIGGGRSRGEVTEHKMCVLIFSKTFVQNIAHSKNSVRYYQKHTQFSCKVLAILVRF